jgi:hypothetical protein
MNWAKYLVLLKEWLQAYWLDHSDKEDTLQ